MSAVAGKAASPSPPAVETPSGKDVAYENFPVGSWLLPARLRPHIATFYAFARAIDDVADNPQLPAREKVRRLDGFEQAIVGAETTNPAYVKAHAMRRSLTELNITTQHCQDLIAAFKQDAVKNRYDDWDEVLGSCMKSAAPVGRYLLDLHGGCRAGYAPSDALCNALQMINHLQDCQEDYRQLDRVYLPTRWVAEAGASIDDLDRPNASPAVRKVLDRTLDAVDGMLATARPLAAGLNSRRLAMEASAIHEIAVTLSQHLRRRDPLAERVALTKPGYAWCCFRGVLRALI